MPETKVTAIYYPEERELTLFKWACRVTAGKPEKPVSLPSTKLISDMLRARHSPIRVLNFAFLIENIPSNTATHFARHVHAQPFISSLRNDRQNVMNGDTAPRNTPVDMILYANAEELMIIANKRLCAKAAENTRKIMQQICAEAARVCPEIAPFLVPMCVYHGGTCHEPEPCGRCVKS